MQKLPLMLFMPFLPLAACGDVDLGRADAGHAAAGASGTGSGGILGTGGSGSGPESTWDAPVSDVPLDGVATFDGVSCQAPNVWRYQEPGCGADAHPVCGSATEDACLRFACGCDGETLEGCDYYPKPWRSQGPCCLSPQSAATPPNLDFFIGLQEGCACDPASDAPQCVPVPSRGLLFSCVGGTWKWDRVADCATLDGGTDGPAALDASVDAPVGQDGPTGPDGPHFTLPDGREISQVDYCLPILPLESGSRYCPATLDEAKAAAGNALDGGVPDGGLPPEGRPEISETLTCLQGPLVLYLPQGHTLGWGTSCYYDASSGQLLAVLAGTDTPTECVDSPTPNTASFIAFVYGQMVTCTSPGFGGT
jgi:hypothetical protein